MRLQTFLVTPQSLTNFLEHSDDKMCLSNLSCLIAGLNDEYYMIAYLGWIAYITTCHGELDKRTYPDFLLDTTPNAAYLHYPAPEQARILL